jgi:hypothetical protein
MSDELTLGQERVPPQPFQANTNLGAVKLSDIMDSIAPMGQAIKAEDLAGEAFTIIRAKPYSSRFEGQDHAWFVVGAFYPDGDIFNTTLGGAAVVEVLDAWAAQGRAEPLVVKLVENEGGKYGRYYTLE